MTEANSHLAAEITTQPEDWLRAAARAEVEQSALPDPGESVAVVGCGTSLYVAQAYAVLREQAGQGLTDAWPASEFRPARVYDRILVISRSGTTTEVVDLLRSLPRAGRPRTSALVADPATPVPGLVDDAVVLADVDERSVVQTRFATSSLALLRAHLGEDLAAAAADARVILQVRPRARAT
jgi:fructoselysine-6-P-deglycase FrlB-like protein